MNRKKLQFAGIVILCLSACSCSGGNDNGGPGLGKCTAQDPCPGNLVCIDDNGNEAVEGTCLRPVAPGGSCLSSDAWCRGGKCEDGRCKSDKPETQDCGPQNPCKTGSRCIGNACIPEVSPGSTCSQANVCSQGECREGKCTLIVALGQACDAGHQCPQGAECQEGICLSPVGDGGDCSSSVTFCNSGKACHKGKCPTGDPGQQKTCDDTDGDGIADIYDRCDIDTDQDGSMDCMDLDADGDTIPDEIERLYEPCSYPADSDYDNVFDFLSKDSDGNGIPDESEGKRKYTSADADDKSLTLIDIDNDGTPDYVLIDSNGDTIPDSADLDNDGDGILDELEIAGGENIYYKEYGIYAPRGADCNGDGKLDEAGSPDQPFDCDNDGIYDYMDADSDGDTVPDRIEYYNDSDRDGLYDRYVQDADGDGISDAVESNCRQDILDLNCRPTRSLNNTNYDFQNPDIDGDGLYDGDEVICGDGSDSRLNKDTDGDGFNDLAEYNASMADDNLKPEDVICNPLIGVTKKEGCDECSGIFKFYFELPYIEKYDPEKEERDTLLFNPAVSKLDVIFNLDTTQSMGVEVKNIQDRVLDTIIPGIRNRVEDSAFGVSHFDDFPTRSTLKSTYDYLDGYAVEDSAYGRIDGPDTPFELLGQPTKNADTVSKNVTKLVLHNGADLPESGFESLWQLVKGDDRSYAPVTWHKYGNFSSWFSDGVIPYTTCQKDNENPNPWGGACFRESTMPVVIHITDTTSHDGNQCDTYTNNPDNFKLSACTVNGKTKTYVQPYDPAYVENTHNSDDVYNAYKEKGARIISIYRAVEADEKGKQLQQLIETSEQTNALVPVCAFRDDKNAWKCGENKCCTTTDSNGIVTGISPNSNGQCVLSYGISDGTKLSTTLVDGIDALVKYATSNVAAVVRGNPIEGTNLTTACLIKAVEALQDGYIAPPQVPEKTCNPVPIPTEFNHAGYNNGYRNFAIGTSSSQKPGSKLNFRVKAENNCVKPTTEPQIFHAVIDIIDPTTGLLFGSEDVSIIVPGEKKATTVVY